jgi:ribonucleoside-triphosphate reductase
MTNSNPEFMGLYEQFIASSRYARWIPEANRRETWEETCRRLSNYWLEKGYINQEESEEIFNAVHQTHVMPSMRTLMTAGKALDRDNVAGFNCSYVALDHPLAFSELMYILLCGTGVGYSVEKKYVSRLPEVADEFSNSEVVINVKDSKIGWCEAMKEMLALLYSGQVPTWDVSRVRAAGAPLKTFGGRASGPGPLVSLMEYTVALFKRAAGRKLTTLEASDLACKIAEVIVVGGVRRSALICLSDPTDERLRNAKSGQWWVDHPERSLANLSAVYEEKPEFPFFLNEAKSLFDSMSGERGMFSRVACQKIVDSHGRRDPNHAFGCNPCSEIILRPNEFCNLSEIIVREGDTLEDLKYKAKIATILGTLQSSLTNFRFLRKIWKKNTEEEALLGVSMTGIMDHSVLSGGEGSELLEEYLVELRRICVETNKEWAAKIGVNPSAAITCVKPSGTVSQLTNSASGIHPRFSKYYIRTVRADVKDPMAQYMLQAGFPCEPDAMKPETTLVFSFPIKSPDSAVTVEEVGALHQLELWKAYQLFWCEHKPSITVYYRQNEEFFDCMSWLYKNFDIASGISFLPYSEHTYAQAPYQEIDEEAYWLAVEQMPDSLNWADLAKFEKEDMTAGSQTMACSAGACEIVDLGGSS